MTIGELRLVILKSTRRNLCGKSSETVINHADLTGIDQIALEFQYR